MYSIPSGEDLEIVPKAPEGYAWSESPEAYVEASFVCIMIDKKYYLVKVYTEEDDK